MDIMKALLLYMTATVALAVQSTAAPQETPAPPAETAAQVEMTETPAPDAEETYTPTAEETYLPDAEGHTPAPSAETKPSPTITPNTRAYHNIGMGAKGREVRRLQERLIELGYLPDGAADGAYGRQTYNAVKKFQAANGLKQDGVAGRATQTHLYEDPDVVPGSLMTPEPTEAPTPKPTETPEPTEALTPKPTETPEPTEAPTPEAIGTPEATGTPEPTEAPTPKTEQATENPDSEPDEIIEDVDLDADVYEPVLGAVALNEGDGPLEFILQEDGVPVTARPRLTSNGTEIRISLDDLCQCAENWRVTDDGLGVIVLEAEGYTLAIYNDDQRCYATVNGAEFAMREEDFDFASEGHFINAAFLARALKGESVWDQEESTLMLRIPHRDIVEGTD